MQVNGSQRTEQFDAIVVCNGHYSEPRVPPIPGAADFPGQQLHTHNFRTNHEFKGKTVVIMGASASGQDVAREIADVAKKVGMVVSLEALHLHANIVVCPPFM